MEGLLDSLVVIGLFALRLGVPVAITLAITWFLRRLDARWEARAQATEQPEGIVQISDQSVPCWEEKGCPETKKAVCGACKWYDLPCWLARLRVENRLPVECTNCHRFRSRPTPQILTI